MAGRGSAHRSPERAGRAAPATPQGWRRDANANPLYRPTQCLLTPGITGIFQVLLLFNHYFRRLPQTPALTQAQQGKNTDSQQG